MTLLRNNQQVVAPVEVGVEGTSMTQVTSGVSEGDLVVLTSTSSTSGSTEQQRNGFQGGPPGGVMPGNGPPVGVR